MPNLESNKGWSSKCQSVLDQVLAICQLPSTQSFKILMSTLHYSPFILGEDTKTVKSRCLGAEIQPKLNLSKTEICFNIILLLNGLACPMKGCISTRLIVFCNLIIILYVQIASEVFLNNIKNDNAPACTRIETLNHDYITYADP